MGLNKLIKDYNFFMAFLFESLLFFNVLFSSYKEFLSLFSFKLSIFYSNLINYTLANKNETFVFSPCLIPPEFGNFY